MQITSSNYEYRKPQPAFGMIPLRRSLSPPSKEGLAIIPLRTQDTGARFPDRATTDTLNQMRQARWATLANIRDYSEAEVAAHLDRTNPDRLNPAPSSYQPPLATQPFHMPRAQVGGPGTGVMTPRSQRLNRAGFNADALTEGLRRFRANGGEIQRYGYGVDEVRTEINRQIAASATQDTLSAPPFVQTQPSTEAHPYGLAYGPPNPSHIQNQAGSSAAPYNSNNLSGIYNPFAQSTSYGHSNLSLPPTHGSEQFGLPGQASTHPFASKHSGYVQPQPPSQALDFSQWQYTASQEAPGLDPNALTNLGQGGYFPLPDLRPEDSYSGASARSHNTDTSQAGPSRSRASGSQGTGGVVRRPKRNHGTNTASSISTASTSRFDLGRCKHTPGGEINSESFKGCDETDVELEQGKLKGKKTAYNRVAQRKSQIRRARERGLTDWKELKELKKTQRDALARKRGLPDRKALNRTQLDALAKERGLTDGKELKKTQRDALARKRGLPDRKALNRTQLDALARERGLTDGKELKRTQLDARARERGLTDGKELKRMQQNEREMAQLMGISVKKFRERFPDDEISTDSSSPSSSRSTSPEFQPPDGVVE